VRLVFDAEVQHASRSQDIVSIATQIGRAAQALNGLLPVSLGSLRSPSGLAPRGNLQGCPAGGRREKPSSASMR
jgi:hypothetical protein